MSIKQLTDQQMLSQMISLVAQEFIAKFDKSGKPYVLHCLKVMEYLHTEDIPIMCIAIGHDLIEDCKHITYKLLRDMGFSERVIEGIRCMTKVSGETNEEYLTRIKSNIDAVRVKLCDLRHNMDARRLKGLTEKDFARMQKYQIMYADLQAHLMKFNCGIEL